MSEPEIPKWRREHSWVLGKTGLAVHPQYGTELWVVVDTTEFDAALTDPLTLKQAMAAAERLARQRRPDLYRTEPKESPPK
jgi:hypothetical protein